MNEDNQVGRRSGMSHAAAAQQLRAAATPAKEHHTDRIRDAARVTLNLGTGELFDAVIQCEEEIGDLHEVIEREAGLRARAEMELQLQRTREATRLENEINSKREAWAGALDAETRARVTAEADLSKACKVLGQLWDLVLEWRKPRPGDRETNLGPTISGCRWEHASELQDILEPGIRALRSEAVPPELLGKLPVVDCNI